MLVLLLTFALFALLVAALAAGRISTLRIVRKRGPGGFAEFASRMGGDAVPHIVQKAVFDCLHEKLRGPFFPLLWLRIDFPIQPEDNLASIWGMDGQDVKDAIREISFKIGRTPPPVVGSDRKSLVTVRDLAEYVAQFPTIPDSGTPQMET